MVIDAQRIFRCTHTFVSVTDAGVLLFACVSCGYRAELLPLVRRTRPAPPQVESRPARRSGAGKRLPKS